MEITKSDIEQIHHNNLVRLCAYRGITIEPFADFSKKKVFHWKTNDGKEDYDVFHIKKSAEANSAAGFNALITKCTGKTIICTHRKKVPHMPPNIEIIHGTALMRDFGAFWEANGTSIRVVPNLGDLTRFYVEKKDLPHIHVSCIEVIWLGAKVGDIIESTRVCIGHTNVTGDYRLVVDAPIK